MRSNRERCIAVDVRCLQDPDYVERGVGRHTLNLLRNAPRLDAMPLVGLTDPGMPPLAESHRALFNVVRPNAQFRELHHAACFIAASPMTHEPLFVARLLNDSRPLKAAVVYDFIPFDIPDRYLARSAQRHAYYTCLNWLKRYDLFLPISQASAGRLSELLGIPEDRITVTGAALDPVFDTGGRREYQPGHVLVIGGGDPRKNVECAVRAHAVSPAMQRRRIPIVVVGNYPPDWTHELRAAARSLGGSPNLVKLPGHISEAELLALYRGAVCAIAPSRAEGFDLPVVEAMASGVPVLASDIPAHRELVKPADRRFAPDDHTRLCELLERLMADPADRVRILEDQAKLWPEFRAETVGRKFWEPIITRLCNASAPAALRARRPTLALLTPLPPDRSGVADYTAASCAELGRLTELHVFTQTEKPLRIPNASTIRPLSAIPHLSAGFDRVVSVMGNSHFHLQIFHQLLRYGGACIAHDSRMLGFYTILLGMERARQVATQELGRSVGSHEIDRWLADETALEALHYAEITSIADPVMVHSPETARLMKGRYGIQPTLLPFCVYRPWTAEELAHRSSARQRLNLVDDDIVIATFGFVHRTKAPLECIWALEILRGWGINASLHFVGADLDGYAADRTAAGLGLADKVVFHGRFVSDETYRDYLLAADLGVQLRLTFLGSLSGALLDCIAAGLPTVANASLVEMMDAPSYVRAVPDTLSPLLIAEALANLIDEGLTRTRPEAARHSYSEAHSFRVYAERVCAALELDVPA